MLCPSTGNVLHNFETGVDAGGLCRRDIVTTLARFSMGGTYGERGGAHHAKVELRISGCERDGRL